MKNMVCWFEIPVCDMKRAIKFYEMILNVKFIPYTANEVEMAIFPHEINSKEYGAAGALVKHKCMAPSATGTIVYFDSENCKSEEGRVVNAGGKVIHTKFEIGDNGFVSICQDTEGNTFGIHSRA
ncbi:MAG: VOC family protein [Fusobacteria bacterium]|nr:VOC family protein [Fusobacteriota bacterium]